MPRRIPRSRNPSAARHVRSDRRGSTILIVLALMGLLALLGFVFYSFAAQEHLNASYYAESAFGSNPELDYFDWGLQQIIVGPPDAARNSALWPGRHSLLNNMFGNMWKPDGWPERGDFQPHNGVGVNVIRTASGALAIDQDYDGLPDVSATDNNSNGIPDFLEPNDSVAAWPTEWNFGYRRDLQNLPNPDVDFTYPDINNMFLAYRGSLTENPAQTVILPSFHRPQILRNNVGAPVTDWATNNTATSSNTASRIFRPHPAHVHKNIPGGAAAPFRRFLDATNPADAVIIAGLPGLSGGFPFNLDSVVNGGDGDGVQEQGVYSSTGVGGINTTYEYDVDTDGDGTKDSNWMDIDFPMFEAGNGIKVVPLFAFQILDADGLFNLNAHGSINRSVPIPGNPAIPFGGGSHLSRSNQGLGQHEVNLLWALSGDPRGPDRISGTPDDVPASAFQQHQRFFSRLPADPVEAANMELVFLKAGRPELSAAGLPAASANITDLIPGVNGEANLMYQWAQGNVSSYPQPSHSWYNANYTGTYHQTGTSLQPQQPDDNYNQYEGDGGGGYLPFGQPLDHAGSGRYLLAGNSKSADLVPFGVGPGRWLNYTGFTSTNPPSTIAWPCVASPLPFNPRIDDQSEIIFEPNYAQKPFDELLGPEEMALLFLSDATLGTVSYSQRLQKLLPFNFSTQSGVSNPAVRQRFSVSSWARRSFALPLAGNPLWPDSDSDKNLEFPPQFAGAAAYSALDPFRTEVRRVLETEYGNVNQSQLQMRLSINHVLDVVRTGGVPANPRTGPLEFRELMPHATAGLTAANINTALILQFGTLPPPYPTDPRVTGLAPLIRLQVQEWWARYDRQRMARDIFVLLYTFCGGSDSLNYTTSPNRVRAVYSDTQLREMAQLAVNIVDALDHDIVVTRFEYDADLSDGWNLDDNPMTIDPDSTDVDGDMNITETHPDRSTVDGVEAQQLTLSEVLPIYARAVDSMGTPTNHAATEWPDTADRYFAYVELRNASPYIVSFANGQWEVAVEPATNKDALPAAKNPAVERRLRLLNPAGSVAPGGLFTVGTAGDTSVVDTSGAGPYSRFKVDPNWTAGAPMLQNIVPATGMDLDLIKDTTGAPRFEVRDGSQPVGNNVTGTLGSFFNQFTAIDVDNSVAFTLYRRLDPNRPAPTIASDELDNPWIEVDEFRTSGLRRFELSSTTSATTMPSISDELNGTGGRPGVRSTQRSEPLLRNKPAEPTQLFAIGGPAPRNSLGANNSNSPAAFTAWQPHFDRDFVSAGELLTIPLDAPKDMTRHILRSRTPPVAQVPPLFPTPVIASAKILQPMHPSAFGVDGVPGSAGDDDGNGTVDDLTEVRSAGSDDLAVPQTLDNKWYRLFEFLEVPTRLHRALSTNQLNLLREPGRINWNTMRHREVLLGLLDDPSVVVSTYETDANNNNVVDPAEDANGNGRWDSTYDVTLPGDPARDWWTEFVMSRDGVPGALGPNSPDPLTGLYLPGLPGSHPFRSFAFNSRGFRSIDDTLLRSLPLDRTIFGQSYGPFGRRMLELGDAPEYASTFTVDPYVRYRLLTKTMNNSTQRSNVFIIYVTVGFFEAYQTATGEVRIGGKLPAVTATTLKLQDKNGFFIVDRSLAEEAYDIGTGNFSKWRNLIKFSMKDY